MTGVAPQLGMDGRECRAQAVCIVVGREILLKRWTQYFGAHVGLQKLGDAAAASKQIRQREVLELVESHDAK